MTGFLPNTEAPRCPNSPGCRSARRMTWSAVRRTSDSADGNVEGEPDGTERAGVLVRMQHVRLIQERLERCCALVARPELRDVLTRHGVTPRRDPKSRPRFL